MATVQIQLKDLHDGQLSVIDNCARFNVLNIGRRWGKTTLAVNELLIQPALDGFPVAYFSPVYSDLHEVWQEIKTILFEVIRSKNEQQKQIVLITGGVIDFWSMDNPDSGRGRHYKRVVVDEAEKAPKFKQAWQGTIRPTLTDLKGDAWILSTPKFGKTYFKELFSFGRDGVKDWAAFNLPTATNPHIDAEEIESLRATMDEMYFRCEILAEDVDLSMRPFAYAFDAQRHVVGCGYEPRLELCLSFDFNVDPITCIAAQHTGIGTGIKVLKEYRLENSDIYELCARIRSDFPKALMLVTGDATGQARSALTKGNINYYQVIRQELGLGQGQMRQPSINPAHKDVRVLINSLLSNTDIIIDPSCKYLVQDLKYVEADDEGGLDKSKEQTAAKIGHLFQAWYYYLNTFHGRFIKMI